MDLQKSAERITKAFDLPNGLNTIGEAHLVGNIAFKTTVKPDIDIQIYSKDSEWQTNAEKIIAYFLNLKLERFIARNLKESNKYLVSFIYEDGEPLWTIDVVQTTPSTVYLKDAYRFFLDYHNKFTDQKRRIIRTLKEYFLSKNMLHHSLSYYIYLAVIDEGAKTVDDIYSYLDRMEVDLKRFKQ